MKKFIQLAAISIVLIALPAASWYFLKSGLDYRKESMNKLGDFGNVPEQNLTVIGRPGLSTSDLENQTLLVQKLASNADTTMTMKLFRQFEKRADIKFLIPENPQLKLVSINKKNLWLLDDNAQSQEFFNAIGLHDENADKVALIDFKGIIRNYYVLNDEIELKQLVEHTAFLLPVHETAKPELQRQDEK